MPNLHQLPFGHFGLKGPETRYRKCYQPLGLIMGENTRVLRSGDLWFPLKARQKEQGDEEAQGNDESFIDAYVLCYYATYN